MIIDGKHIAQEILVSLKEKVREQSSVPHLTVITCAPNFETQKYLDIKKKKATEVGINLNVIELLPAVPTSEVTKLIDEVANQSETNGIIIQLPFPGTINTSELIAHIPASLDVDGLTENSTVLSPVVGAIQEICQRHNVILKNKKIVVVGKGRLVGEPAARWFSTEGALVEVCTKDSGSLKERTHNADVLILGAGAPHLLKPDMVKEGVVIFDAGTSEEGGQLRGDVDPECAKKASIFTPVPGGIGPITIAVLLRNLVWLTEKR